MLQRLISHWVYGAGPCALLLLALAPLLLAGWPAPLAAAFLHWPAYMLHQVEEHDGDRFRLFFNETLGGGLEVLTPLAVFITNVPGVWGVIVMSLYAARVDAGWALVAADLVLVNALVHIAHAIAFRRYNPGLFTAITVFLPLGGATVVLVQRAGAGSLSCHAASLALAVAIHLAIIVHVRRRAGVLQRRGAS